ncbi:Rv3235 family protein [Ornithinimicrobium avium]|uniref:Uncharacterized protein n=1 Tax=Ornithinimicrobium avium TaxID=2283195 RepID=A0A345NLB4_9MICO|nr:Rv3235 family protein [Ornithinimicrobium avium]AXH95822.1 hypothetical protein DV701_06485 [Ornithinimicrobium avium]
MSTAPGTGTAVVEGTSALASPGTLPRTGSAPASGDAPRTAPPVLRVLPAPSTDPASEGLDWGGAEPPAPSPFVQGRLPVDLRPGPDDDAFFGPQPTATPDLPEATAWARRMVQALLETYDGTRRADQLSRWVTPEIRDRARRRGLLARRRGRRTTRPPVVRSIHPTFPAEGVCEISAVVWAEGKVRAMALRMTGVDGRWLISALEVG